MILLLTKQNKNEADIDEIINLMIGLYCRFNSSDIINLLKYKSRTVFFNEEHTEIRIGGSNDFKVLIKQKTPEYLLIDIMTSNVELKQHTKKLLCAMFPNIQMFAVDAGGKIEVAN